MKSETQNYTLIMPRYGATSGAAISGNDSAPSWIERILYSWATVLHTPGRDVDDDELRGWVALTRRARRRWLRENEY